MVHRHHVVFSILIIVHQQRPRIVNSMVLTIQQINRQQQRQQVVTVECIDVNHSCINATVTMIFHRNVFRAIRPSDLNCK